LSHLPTKTSHLEVQSPAVDSTSCRQLKATYHTPSASAPSTCTATLPLSTMCGNVITTYRCLDCKDKRYTRTEAIICDDALRVGGGFGKGCLLTRDEKVSEPLGRCTSCARIHKDKEEKRLFEKEIRRENEEAKRQGERREEEERRAREKGDDDFGSYYSVMYARR
jgi:hypothetical protein